MLFQMSLLLALFNIIIGVSSCWRWSSLWHLIWAWKYFGAMVQIQEHKVLGNGQVIENTLAKRAQVMIHRFKIGGDGEAHHARLVENIGPCAR